MEEREEGGGKSESLRRIAETRGFYSLETCPGVGGSPIRQLGTEAP